MITFNGTPIITAAEGNFSPTELGVLPRVWQMKRAVRAAGEVAFDKGRAGADHRITVVFMDVPIASARAILDRMDALHATPQEGDLVIPDFGTFPNCIVTEVVPSPTTRTISNLVASGSGFDMDKTYRLEYALTFRQLRP